MADTPPAPGGKGAGSFLSKDTAGLPNWAWIVVIGAGIAAVYVVPKFLGQSSSPSSTSGTSGDTSGLGLAIDPTTGLPYAVEGLVPSGGTTGTGIDGPVASGQPIIGSSQGEVGTIRLPGAQGSPTYGADLTESGIPILSTPNVANFQQSELGLAPYGSQLVITGPPVQGSYNFANNAPGGSTTWYPVQFQGKSGYVSAYDIGQFQQVAVNANTWPGQK